MARYDTSWQNSAKKKRVARVRWARVLAAPAAALGLLLVGWALIHSPLLRVREVVVANAARVEKEAVSDAAKAARTGFIRRAISPANLLGWPGALPPEAVALVPGAEAIEVDRSFFTGTVTLVVREREPVGIWCFEGDPSAPVCQWFDERGVVYSRTTPGEGSLIAVAHDLDQARAGSGRRVLQDEQLAHFLAILAILRERGISPRVMEVRSGSRAELSMTTYNGPRLIFTLRTPPDQVEPVLDDFIKRGALGGLTYIDFRSAKRAFYQ